MEFEINRVVLDYTRARRQMLGSISNAGPTRHLRDWRTHARASTHDTTPTSGVSD
jgi:hypothetical protein